ncbi:MAG: deoxynucleoside kinase [Rikenellaceae bacterium]|nr:deoxynucleoside kinase [Rikenellaceae bacterium]
MYIAIAGNIGSGKTSLTEILAERFSATAHYESVDNPYISDVYDDLNRWSFHLQISFLGSRIEQAIRALGAGGSVIQDRTIYEDAYIFAQNLYEMGLMNTRDFETYMNIFKLSTGLIQRPDLLIYLKASEDTLIEQIHRRGRSYEMSIDRNYLERLNKKYEHWVSEIYDGEILVVDIDHCDFVNNPADADRIIEQINNRLAK